MPIGTSDGEHFDDEFQQAVSKYLPKDQERVGDRQPTPNDRVHDAFADMAASPYQDPKMVWGGRQPSLQPTEENSQLSSRPFPGNETDYLQRNAKEREGPPQFDPDAPLDINRNLQKVLADPKIQEAINNPKIDRSHDVPYEAGASNKPDDFTTHIDKRIPTSVNIDGKTFDPAIPANIHEQVEREVMERLIHMGMKEEKAYEIAHHEYAEPAEDMWYKQQGIDIDKVNQWWSAQDKITEHENPKNPPPNLYTKPYPHNKVEGISHEPTGVYAEWPTNTPVELAAYVPHKDPRFGPTGGESMPGLERPLAPRGGTPSKISTDPVKFDKLMEGIQAGKSQRTLAKELGIGRTSVQRYLQDQLQVKESPGVVESFWKVGKINALKELYKQGYSQNEIARRIGTTPGNVASKLQRLQRDDELPDLGRREPSLPKLKFLETPMEQEE